MMKILSLSSFFLAAIMGMLHPAAAQTRNHPYLYFTAPRIQQVKESIKTDTAMAHTWKKMQERADRAIDEGKPGSLEMMSLAWVMTKETKYADAAKTGLMKLVSQKQWDGMDDRTPRWNSGLATARSCFTAALAFDCIHDYLTKEERRKVADAIVSLGIKPSIDDWLSNDKRLHTLNSMGHNWWSACVHMAGVASLAVREEVPEARQWAADIMDAASQWFAFNGSVLENKPSNFDPAGGFYESVNYAAFGLSEYLLFRLAYTNAVGAVTMPYDPMLEKTADWFINVCYPNTGPLMSLNFGDSNPQATGERPIKLMMALGFDKERYRWYLGQVSRGQFHEGLDADTPIGFVYTPRDNTKTVVTPDLPASALYADMGWAVMRSSWQKDATLLAVKSGYTWNHAHADAGSFVLYHKGKNLLIDGGDVSYGLPEYSGYFVRSEAHNVMLFNGKAQERQDQYHAVKTPGRLYNLIDGGDLKYVLADATPPTARFFLRNYRNFLWVGNVILVIDDVKAYEPGKFEWLLHFDNTARKKGSDLEITHDAAGVLVRPLFPETLPAGYPHDFPEKLRLEERTGIKDRDAKSKIPYYAISPAQDTQQVKFITAIVLLDDGNKPVETFTGSSGATGGAARDNLPQIERLQGNDMIGVKITRNGETTYVYVNLLADGRLMHRNSINTIDGWQTDAYIFATTFAAKDDHNDPDKLKSLFVSNGSFLRKDNKVVLHSLSKVFIYAKQIGSTAEVLLQGQPFIQAYLRNTVKPRQMLLNNKKIQPEYKGDKKLMVLTLEENVK